MSGPDEHFDPRLARSLSNNEICGVDLFGRGGTYTAEGFTALCEALKVSAVTSLECAAAANVYPWTARSVKPP